MRLLGVFIGLCVVMLGVVAWHVVAGLRDRSAAPLVAAPALQTASAPAARALTTPATQPGAPSPAEPAPPPVAEPAIILTSQPVVHWSVDPEVRSAARRLERAQVALHDQPDHVGALREELAALTELGFWSDAAETLARLVALDPDNVSLRFEQATMLMQARRWVEAIVVLKSVISAEPDHTRAWFNLAVAHQAVGHLAEARQTWDRAIALDPTPAALARRGEVLLDLHEWAAAATDFENVLASEPDAADAVLNLTLAWARLGRVDEARAKLEAYLAGHPHHVPTLNRLAELAWAQCRAAAGNPRACADAARWCRESLANNPDQPDVRALLETAAQIASPAQ